MFLRIVRARSAEQSGIKGVKRHFDPNIIILCEVTAVHSPLFQRKPQPLNPYSI